MLDCTACVLRHCCCGNHVGYSTDSVLPYKSSTDIMKYDANCCPKKYFKTLQSTEGTQYCIIIIRPLLKGRVGSLVFSSIHPCRFWRWLHDIMMAEISQVQPRLISPSCTELSTDRVSSRLDLVAKRLNCNVMWSRIKNQGVLTWYKLTLWKEQLLSVEITCGSHWCACSKPNNIEDPGHFKHRPSLVSWAANVS